MWKMIKTILKGFLISITTSIILSLPLLSYIYFYRIEFLYSYLILFTVLFYYILGRMFTKKKLDHTNYDKITAIIRQEIANSMIKSYKTTVINNRKGI